MELRDSFDHITMDNIQKLNHELEIQLPKDYEEFLLKHNGGQPIKNSFNKIGADGGIEHKFIINDFYGIGDNDETNGDVLTMFAIYCDQIPTEVLPIADNGIGDVICLGIEGEYFGKVYIWWKDGEVDEDEEPNFDNIDLVADSFDEFINGTWS